MVNVVYCRKIDGLKMRHFRNVCIDMRQLQNREDIQAGSCLGYSIGSKTEDARELAGRYRKQTVVCEDT